MSPKAIPNYFFSVISVKRVPLSKQGQHLFTSLSILIISVSEDIVTVLLTMIRLQKSITKVHLHIAVSRKVVLQKRQVKCSDMFGHGFE